MGCAQSRREARGDTCRTLKKIRRARPPGRENRPPEGGPCGRDGLSGAATAGPYVARGRRRARALTPGRDGGTCWARGRERAAVGGAWGRRDAVQAMGTQGAAASLDDTTRLRGPELVEHAVMRAEFFLASGTCPRVLPGGSARTPRAEARSVGIRMSFFVLVVDIYVCKVRGSLETGTELPQMTLGERVRMRIEVETHHKKHFVTALSSHTPPHRHHARPIGARHDRTAAGRRVRPVLVAKSAGRDTPGLPHGRPLTGRSSRRTGTNALHGRRTSQSLAR